MREDGVVERGVCVSEDKLLEQVCYDEKEVGGDWVALA